MAATVADARRVFLSPPPRAGARRKFEFVRVATRRDELSTCSREVLPTAYTASGGVEPQFQLYTRGAVGGAPRRQAGHPLRGCAGRAGGFHRAGEFLDQDEGVWWKLTPASRDAARSCKKASPGGPRELELPPARAASNVPRATSVLAASSSTTPRKVIATSAALVIGDGGVAPGGAEPAPE